MSLEEKLQKWKDEMNISQQQGQKPPPPPLTPEEHAALTSRDKDLVQKYAKDVAASRTSTTANTAVGAPPPPPPPPPHAAAPLQPAAQSPDLLAAIRGKHKLRKAPTRSDDTVPTVATTQSNTMQSFADELSKALKGRTPNRKTPIDTGRLSDAETREQEVKGDERVQDAAPVVKPPHNPNPTKTTQVETEAQKEQRLIKAQKDAFESYQQNQKILTLRLSTEPEDAAEKIEAASNKYKQTLQPKQRSAFEVYQRVLSESSNLNKEARDQATREATETFKQSLNIIEAIAPVVPTQAAPSRDIQHPVAASAKSVLPTAKKHEVTEPKSVLKATQLAQLSNPPVISPKSSGLDAELQLVKSEEHERVFQAATLSTATIVRPVVAPAKPAPPEVPPKSQKALAESEAARGKGTAAVANAPPPLAETPLKKAAKAKTWGPQLDDLTRQLELRLAKAIMIQEKIVIQEKLDGKGIGSILTAGPTSPHFKNAEAAYKGMNDITTQFGATRSDSIITLSNKPDPNSRKPGPIEITQKAIADLNKHLKSLETAVRAVGKPRNAEVMSIRAIIDTHIGSHYTTTALIDKIRENITTKLDKHPTLSSSVSKPVAQHSQVAQNDLPHRESLVAEQIRQDNLLAQKLARGEGATQQELFAQLTDKSRAQNTHQRQASPPAGDPSPLARISELEARQLVLEQANARALAAAARGQAPLSPTLSSQAPQMFDSRGHDQPASSRQQKDYDSLLIKFQKAVAKHPDAQVLNRELLNKKTILEENDREPVDHIQFLATQLSQERKPLSDAPGFTQQADGTYKITNSSALHGPIFMSRVDNSTPPKQVKGADGQPVYDVLHYESGKLKPEKSFIAPDGVPPGSKPTIDPTTRGEILAVHAKIKQDRAMGTTKFPPDVAAQAVDQGKKALLPYPPASQPAKKWPTVQTTGRGH